MYTIYIHRNKINNKAYIGQTCLNVRARWENGNGYRNNKYLYRAIEKYGWDNFEHIIWAENLTLEEANSVEELLIALFNTTNNSYGYNLRAGGNNSRMHESSKRKISEACKGIAAGAKNPAARAVVQYD